MACPMQIKILSSFTFLNGYRADITVGTILAKTFLHVFKTSFIIANLVYLFANMWYSIFEWSSIQLGTLHTREYKNFSGFPFVGAPFNISTHSLKAMKLMAVHKQNGFRLECANLEHDWIYLRYCHKQTSNNQQTNSSNGEGNEKRTIQMCAQCFAILCRSAFPVPESSWPCVFRLFLNGGDLHGPPIKTRQQQRKWKKKQKKKTLWDRNAYMLYRCYWFLNKDHAYTERIKRT